MKHKIIGGIMILVGIVGLVLAFSFRPPENVGEMVTMITQGQRFYLKPPVFYGALAFSGLFIVGGAWRLWLALKEG